MSSIDDLRAEHGDCVAGAVMLTREEYERCQSYPGALATILEHKAQNVAASLFAAAHARWEPAA